MADRFQYSFTKWIWQHLPKRIVALKETSLWGRVLKTLLKPVQVLLVPMANEFMNAIFLTTAKDEALEKHGAEYRLRKSPGETQDEYRARIVSLRQARRSGAVKSTLKSLAFVYLGVNAEIIEAFKNDSNAFTVGVTPIAPDDTKPPQFYALGVAAAPPLDSDFLAFTYWIILPDLSARENVPRTDFVRAVERANYGGNEPIVFEKREKITAFTVGISRMGLETYMMRRLVPEAYNTKRYN